MRWLRGRFRHKKPINTDDVDDTTGDRLQLIYRDVMTLTDFLQYGKHFIIRTPNTTVTLTVEHDRYENDLTTFAIVTDDPFSLVTANRDYGHALLVFTRHPLIDGQEGDAS